VGIRAPNRPDGRCRGIRVIVFSRLPVLLRASIPLVVAHPETRDDFSVDEVRESEAFVETSRRSVLATGRHDGTMHVRQDAPHEASAGAPAVPRRIDHHPVDVGLAAIDAIADRSDDGPSFVTLEDPGEIGRSHVVLGLVQRGNPGITEEACFSQVGVTLHAEDISHVCIRKR
jgi:hypothetical protein